MKPFAPKPFGIGDVVVWRHIDTFGTSTERIGEIVCEAPSVKGCSARWVVPAEQLPGDPYSMVMVVKVARKSGLNPTAIYGVPSAKQGELVSWDHWATDTGSMAAAAHTAGQRVKTAAAEKFLDDHVEIIHIAA